MRNTKSPQINDFDSISHDLSSTSTFHRPKQVLRGWRSRILPCAPKKRTEVSTNNPIKYNDSWIFSVPKIIRETHLEDSYVIGLHYWRFYSLNLEWAQEIGHFRNPSGNAEAGGPRVSQWGPLLLKFEFPKNRIQSYVLEI